MSKELELQQKLEVIKAIPRDSIKTPKAIPVKIYIQEAENLYQWCQADKDALVAGGLDWTIVDDMPLRSGALSAAEGEWVKERFGQEEARRQWNQDYPKAYKLRKELMHRLRFAYRKDASLLGRLNAIAEGFGHADMIQDLINLSILGKANTEPLTKINFDMTLLDRSSQMSDQLGPLWGMATGDRMGHSEIKKVRDQAYTHLKEAVDEVRDFGQYVFWEDEERFNGYMSSYSRRKDNAEEEEVKPATTTAEQTQVQTETTKSAVVTTQGSDVTTKSAG
ncbi:MAG: hypothetical protein EHM12_08895 [Dehalococcoidia bacterium]|nr:MAG: hypothetical protein EHM12_08895 [Dehalococcoidia bacterium]